MGQGDTWLNAIVGAAVTILLSATGVGPIIGGLAAGYLEGGSNADGARVGALTGLLAGVPLAIVLLTVGSALVAVIPFLGLSEAAIGAAGLIIVILIFGGLFLVTVLLSALGGYAGAAIRTEPVPNP